MNKYNIIYADPPWPYKNKRTGGSMSSGASDKYSIMILKDIIDLPVQSLTGRDAVLFLWSTVPFLHEAFHVMEAWGYTYKTTIFWRKIMSLGMGFWFRGQVEVCLFGIKGKVPAFRCQQANFMQVKALKHSQKPEEMYRLIESVTEEPRMELFARKRRPGWDAWGNEIESDIEL